VYYVVFPHPRYRHPVEPAIAILCVFVITQAETRAKPKPSDSAPQ
jgi:hypothetical protein